MRLRQVRKQHPKWKKKAAALQKWVLENFESEKKHKELASALIPEVSTEEAEWLEQLSDIEIL